MRQRFLPILLLTMLLGCSKSDSNPIMDFGEGEGITYRDEQNVPMGPRDYSDWTSDGEWNKQERALFSDLSLDLNGMQQLGFTGENSAYPNPCLNGKACWNLDGKWASFRVRPTHWTAVLVDRQYRVVLASGLREYMANSMSFQMNYRELGLSPNELYRFYYVLYNANGLVYKGHGDVRYSPQ